MYKKIINNTFLKELIEFDFALAKSSIAKNNLNNVSARLKLGDKQDFNILDIFKLTQSLKQFIRILYFLQSTKARTNLRPSFIIYIWCTNKFILNLIDLYVQKNDLKHYIFTTEVCPVANTIRDKNKRKFLFILGSPWEITPERTLHEKILENKFYLVNLLDFNAEKSEFNTYKIQNDLADYKKLMVLIVIIERILSLNPLICGPQLPKKKLKKKRK